MRLSHLRAISIVCILAAAPLAAAGADTALLDAAKNGDVTAVRTALLAHADVNARTADGSTALHWAAYRNQLEAADLLIRGGADVRLANRYSVTPLSLACTNGNATLIERLLKAGADPNTALPGGETALMTAARSGNVEAIGVLLAHGADVNTRERTRGQTALMWAAGQNNVGAIRALVAAGADVHARSVERFRSGRAMDGAAEATSGARVEFTALMFAVRRGHMDATRTLLELGANVNDTTADGTGTLAVAIINGHWELAALLVERGADVNAAGQGWTPLHQLARSRAPNIGVLPPPVATGRLSSFELAKLLVARGADINARATKNMNDGYRLFMSRIGATPLLMAAKGVDVELLRLLLAHGADPLAPNAAGTTPLMAAAGVDMAYQGEDSGTNEDALASVKLLLEAGADLTAVNKNGETALHGAARRGANAVVQLLVDQGARLDIVSKRGLTPLNFAEGKSEAVLRAQPQTAALIREMMQARGIPITDEDAGNIEQKLPAR
jgi:uncharacterized protein